MTAPCPRCVREHRPADLEAGRRCTTCHELIVADTCRVLLEGLRLPRRRWYGRRAA